MTINIYIYIYTYIYILCMMSGRLYIIIILHARGFKVCHTVVICMNLNKNQIEDSAGEKSQRWIT